MRQLLALALLAGCASQAPYSRAPLACQDQAMDLVWRQQYGRTDPPPEVWWVPASALDCQDPGHAPGYRMGTLCVGGNSWRDGMNLAQYRPWEKTDLAHEAAHVAQARDGLPPDVAHITAPFQPGGAMALANAALAAAHLCGP